MLKGRGAQKNVGNRFLKHAYVTAYLEGLDEPLLRNAATKYVDTFPKTIINKVDSPDIGMAYSLNPYQGCEHGCVYCYARNTHEYWGYNAGLDFERVILVKRNAPQLLEQQFQHPKWEPMPVMFSGNTDCYQPVERKLKITRKLLDIFLKYRHPVGLITKNSLVTRDLDIIKSLAKWQLVSVSLSITTLNEEVRRKLEPRTASAKNRINAVKKLSENGIPVNVMIAPIIPGLNDHEIPEIMEKVAAAGAVSAAYTIVRLNGAIGDIFECWIKEAFPNKAEKVINQIKAAHGGQLNDSRFGTRMRGEGRIVESIHRLFEMSRARYFAGKKHPGLRTDLFVKTNQGQLGLF